MGIARHLRRAEKALLATGLSLIAIWAVADLHSKQAAKAAIVQFRSKNIDVTTHANRDALAENSPAALAILRINKVHISVPVFNGTDESTLHIGVGRIPGTARIGEIGNLAIAGHRDTFFRGLKDISIGDLIELERSAQIDDYTVSQIRIVQPEETSVLNPTTDPTLTLVTCFPFYFVGSAPERYIVTASLRGSTRPAPGLDDLNVAQN